MQRINTKSTWSSSQPIWANRKFWTRPRTRNSNFSSAHCSSECLCSDLSDQAWHWAFRKRAPDSCHNDSTHFASTESGVELNELYFGLFLFFFFFFRLLTSWVISPHCTTLHQWITELDSGPWNRDPWMRCATCALTLSMTIILDIHGPSTIYNAYILQLNPAIIHYSCPTVGQTHYPVYYAHTYVRSHGLSHSLLPYN